MKSVFGSPEWVFYYTKLISQKHCIVSQVPGSTKTTILPVSFKTEKEAENAAR